MSSGEFATVVISSITISRDERIRKEIAPTKLEELADSIRRLGLIHPPVITRERVLVAGERRLSAMSLLGWTSTPIQWVDTLDPNELLAIELEENIKRLDITWQEECDTILRFHDLQRATHEEWRLEDTSRELGISLASVSDKLQVARGLASGEARVVNADRYSVAKNVTKRLAERRASDQLALIDISLEIEKPESPILLADFREWVKTYDGPAFNLLHCDFPYGINADKFNQGAANELGGYDDTPETYFTLIDTLVDNRDRLLGTSAHVIFWFSIRYYTETLARLSQVFWVDPYPLVWHKSDNKGTLPDPERGPRRVYEVAFLCSYGDRKILQAVSNTFSGPSQRDGQHMSEKSEDMLAYFMKMTVDENTRLLDPTAGSGSALRAADRLGAGSVLGLEMNEEFVKNAQRAWDARGA